MDDVCSGDLLRDLFGAGPLPDFTVAYFADNDYRSHEVGPIAALPVVERVDRMLGDAFEAGGGIERVLSDTFVIVTSDHGHCEVLDRPGSAIHLDHILGNFRQAELGNCWRDRDELMICPNMRAAQIYLREPLPELAQYLIATLIEAPGIDQIMWRTALTHPGREGYSVASRHGRIDFSKGTTLGSTGIDEHGRPWTWRGDAGPLDVHHAARTLAFGQYPNAFERIAGALDLDRSGELWVTAQPGFEFEVPGGEAHVGGASHGALHALDSLCPVILAGPQRRRLPSRMRSVDILPLALELLGVPIPPRSAPLGMTHV